MVMISRRNSAGLRQIPAASCFHEVNGFYPRTGAGTGFDRPGIERRKER
jgi:hypothetical protein